MLILFTLKPFTLIILGEPLPKETIMKTSKIFTTIMAVILVVTFSSSAHALGKKEEKIAIGVGIAAIAIAIFGDRGSYTSSSADDFGYEDCTRYPQGYRSYNKCYERQQALQYFESNFEYMYYYVENNYPNMQELVNQQVLLSMKKDVGKISAAEVKKLAEVGKNIAAINREINQNRNIRASKKALQDAQSSYERAGGREDLKSLMYAKYSSTGEYDDIINFN